MYPLQTKKRAFFIECVSMKEEETKQQDNFNLLLSVKKIREKAICVVPDNIILFKCSPTCITDKANMF